jgi:hypothetical protein
MSSVSRSSMRDSCFTEPLHSSAFTLQQRQYTQAQNEVGRRPATEYFLYRSRIATTTCYLRHHKRNMRSKM